MRNDTPKEWKDLKLDFMSLVVSDKSLIIAQGKKKKMDININEIKHFMSMVFWGANMGDAMIFRIETQPMLH